MSLEKIGIDHVIRTNINCEDCSEGYYLWKGMFKGDYYFVCDKCGESRRFENISFDFVITEEAACLTQLLETTK